MSEADDSRLLTYVGIAIAVLITAQVGLLLVSSMGSSGNEAGGESSWRLERVNATYVRITHAGGEPVPAEDLQVTVNGYERRVSWSGSVAEGDSTLVQARREQVIQLYRLTERGTQEPLDSWQEA